MILSVSAKAEMPDARPRVELVPPYVATAAEETIDLLKVLGMRLMPWQERFLAQLLGEDDQGKWSAPEACLLVPRQNGKSFVMAARILAGLFLCGEEMINYTAQRVDTALEVFNLVDRLARAHPSTEKLILKTIRTGGKETLELKNGQRFKIMARSRSTGRGFTGDCLIMDEALELRDHGPINALLPTLATRPNAQLIYASSAGDAGSVVLAQVRDRGHRSEPGLLFAEYATHREADPDDEQALTEANPGCPELISWEAIKRERARMSLDGFRQERMGLWAHEQSKAVIAPQVWRDTTKIITVAPEPGKIGLAFDVSIDRGHSTIMIGWKVPSGVHIRLSRHDAGDDWLIDDLEGLAKAWQAEVTYDDAGPARDIGEALRLRNVKINGLNGRDFGSSCARLVSGLNGQTISHHPNAPLDEAADTATARSVGEGWAFARRNASVPICPITAGAMAVWAVDHLAPPRPKFRTF